MARPLVLASLLLMIVIYNNNNHNNARAQDQQPHLLYSRSRNSPTMQQHLHSNNVDTLDQSSSSSSNSNNNDISDKTVIDDKSLPQKELEIVKRSILDMLGLKEAPRLKTKPVVSEDMWKRYLELQQHQQQSSQSSSQSSDEISPDEIDNTDHNHNNNCGSSSSGNNARCHNKRVVRAASSITIGATKASSGGTTSSNVSGNNSGSRSAKKTSNPTRNAKDTGKCQRNEIRIDFARVGWSDWIIAPNFYEAYYCSGDCSWPLNTHLNASNHAIIQSLYHSVGKVNVPRACCVPTKLSPVSILYTDEYGQVQLRNYKDMQVEGCGCQ